MSKTLKIALWLLMTTALSFGFFHHITFPLELNFERLHIFLFNLVSGGTILLYYTEGKNRLSNQIKIFIFLSLFFALAAFLEWYLLTLLLSLILAGMVDFIRISHFGSFFPRALFSKNEPISRKFHQASLFCLTLALLLSSFAILNSEFTHWFLLEKLTLNTFFLGYSFPISLISMSVIFDLMRKNFSPRRLILKEFSFWSINLGVIIFFLFILCGWFLPQVFIALFLFLTVSLILYLFWREGSHLQQKTFLISGIIFLVITSITGILYIFLEFSNYYEPQYSVPLIRLHAFTALYGWNLSGLAVISRHRDFPIQLHSLKVIFLHWITVLFLCPIGFFYPIPAIAAVGCYSWLLFILFFNKTTEDKNILQQKH